MPIPFIDLKRIEKNLKTEWINKVTELSNNTAFIGGPEIQTFEKNIAKDCETNFAISCANGTDALQVALRAVGVEKDDIVLLPDATFWATFEAIVNVGANPVTVDINPDDLQMDFDQFKKAVEKFKPKAAILVHLYGWASNQLEEYRTYCKDNKILLIEDGAQAYGVKYKNESNYKNALISTISFYPAKVYGAAGDAGAITTSDETIAKKARSLCNHGRSEHYSYEYVGWNSRMDSMQAAFLNLVHPHLPKRIESRQVSAKHYRTKLDNIADLTCVEAPSDYIENGYLNCILVDATKRDSITNHLKTQGIGFGIVYPEPMSMQSGAKKYLVGTQGGEEALKLSKSVICLPLFAYMTDSEINEVCNAMTQAIKV